MSYVYYNPNPTGRSVGDCTVRAIARTLGIDWDEAYCALALQGYCMGDMPSADNVWGAYLRSKGLSRHLIPDACLDCYTVADFAAEHPQGAYLLALPGHVIAVRDGDIYDSWDSSNGVPTYYWSFDEEQTHREKE